MRLPGSRVASTVADAKPDLGPHSAALRTRNDGLPEIEELPELNLGKDIALFDERQG